MKDTSSNKLRRYSMFLVQDDRIENKYEEVEAGERGGRIIGYLRVGSAIIQYIKLKEYNVLT